MRDTATQKPRPSALNRLFVAVVGAIDQRIPFHRFPRLIGLLMLIGIRRKLRWENLADTTTVPPPVAPPDGGNRHLTARTADGSYNDLSHPWMGQAGTRFGRNVPIERTQPDGEPALLKPNPRVVSRELLTRETFQPATILNVLAAAWLQFMIRDWFSHGRGDKNNVITVPLTDDDPWPERPMRVIRTPADPTRLPSEAGQPPTYLNTETHWWDASQLYGSHRDRQTAVRAGQDGKLRLTEAGALPDEFLAAAGQEPGWWLGLALLQTLFAREHNAICDRFKSAYPSWTDDELFDHARLVNAALIAKIHTIEWTPGILPHPTMQTAMRANWFGIAEERVHKLFGRISSSEIVSGIMGAATDHFGVPYAITEEFVAVYRMHPLMPDDFTFRSATDDRLLREVTFPQLAGRQTQGILNELGLIDSLYSLGIAHPGAVVLHNFPRSLQRFERPDGIIVDLAATDILRSRELGVPRYNAFRQLLHLPPARSFEELTANPVWREQIRRVYDNDIDRVDLTIGLFAEPIPPGFGFSDTALRIFALMASRRLNSDRFFTTDYTARVYTQIGLDWIDDNDMSSVLLRHFPALAPTLRGVENAFAPWSRLSHEAMAARSAR